MKTWLSMAVVALAMGAFGGASAAGVQQAFLVQNSGWMEPFYTDPASQFKPLIAAVAQSVTSANDPVYLMAFSQSSGTNVSPMLLEAGAGATGISGPLGSLVIAHKSPGGALADTDFKEAIVKTISGPFHSAPGIVWIFTNNKNSPGNDQATAARNLDFYKLLHLEPSITKTLVFPLRMPVKGKLYQAQGMMVYALAYGEPAAQALDQILKEGRLSQVLTRPPARSADCSRIGGEFAGRTRKPRTRPAHVDPRRERRQHSADRGHARLAAKLVLPIRDTACNGDSGHGATGSHHTGGRIAWHD
jgi:hypothetical protein